MADPAGTSRAYNRPSFASVGRLDEPLHQDLKEKKRSYMSDLNPVSYRESRQTELESLVFDERNKVRRKASIGKQHFREPEPTTSRESVQTNLELLGLDERNKTRRETSLKDDLDRKSITTNKGSVENQEPSVLNDENSTKTKEHMDLKAPTNPAESVSTLTSHESPGSQSPRPTIRLTSSIYVPNREGRQSPPPPVDPQDKSEINDTISIADASTSMSMVPPGIATAAKSAARRNDATTSMLRFLPVSSRNADAKEAGRTGTKPSYVLIKNTYTNTSDISSRNSAPKIPEFKPAGISPRNTRLKDAVTSTTGISARTAAAPNAVSTSTLPAGNVSSRNTDMMDIDVSTDNLPLSKVPLINAYTSTTGIPPRSDLANKNTSITGILSTSRATARVVDKNSSTTERTSRNVGIADSNTSTSGIVPRSVGKTDVNTSTSGITVPRNGGMVDANTSTSVIPVPRKVDPVDMVTNKTTDDQQGPVELVDKQISTTGISPRVVEQAAVGTSTTDISPRLDELDDVERSSTSASPAGNVEPVDDTRLSLRASSVDQQPSDVTEVELHHDDLINAEISSRVVDIGISADQFRDIKPPMPVRTDRTTSIDQSRTLLHKIPTNEARRFKRQHVDNTHDATTSVSELKEPLKPTVRMHEIGTNTVPSQPMGAEHVSHNDFERGMRAEEESVIILDIDSTQRSAPRILEEEMLDTKRSAVVASHKKDDQIVQISSGVYSFVNHETLLVPIGTVRDSEDTGIKHGPRYVDASKLASRSQADQPPAVHKEPPAVHKEKPVVRHTERSLERVTVGERIRSGDDPSMDRLEATGVFNNARPFLLNWTERQPWKPRGRIPPLGEEEDEVFKRLAGSDPPDGQGRQQRMECKICGRVFNSEAFDVHLRSCQRSQARQSAPKWKP